MIDATISRVRMRELARLGRSVPGHAPGRRPSDDGAPRRQSGTDADRIGSDLATRPRAASSRPGVCDLMASTI